MNIKKQDLIKVYNFLNGASLVGAVSRARTKLNKSIAEAFQEMQSDESDLVKEYGGEIVQDGAVKFDKERQDDKVAFNKAMLELHEESAVFTETTQDQFNRLKTALESYDKELSNQDAEAYDILLSALEEEK
ncbi:hypothetical protein BMS77_02050 [Leuconostoc pseudomesenteroides]|uniref:Uncharacterized protein n=1 Tax=Leuconostoc pseudomesenteroides TaxID=33968 RepID=A0A1X0VEN8_LEUPS|nr:hypothetical protein [Leuconostoc pseudomesenteroides]OQJ73323.1 hypothetical protein BMS77_02050 [Leuconostoc pseudomesenteroides]OQJ77525.1 hypothetical protein BMS83_01810 [Leuconostoc pseudomesenteroides]OQJ78180.1 hypothetical protein BMS82_03790 [Leuconostoc pseudomesenteroides]ORI37634.1 hypothetical protein BMR88_03775 [Leuconostoc pseudomesenteroides]ORI46021.1 hypothetical protein BMR94_04250 [Leuconostoc pseudomesenteroides]